LKKLQYWRETHNGEDFQNRNVPELTQFNNISVKEVEKFFKAKQLYSKNNANNNNYNTKSPPGINNYI
jgi:hypothetical protein